MPKPELNATISERIDFGPELMVLRVVPDGWPLPTYKPGQFAILGLQGSAQRKADSPPDKTPADPEKFIQRAYSIASSPLTRDYLELNITLVKDGSLTPRLFNLTSGNKIWLSPKISGSFTMEEVPADKNVIFIGTGTGIAPFMSMIETYLKPDSPRKFALFHGVRQSQDLGYRDRCMLLSRICTNFSYHPIISRPQNDPVAWNGITGHVQKLWEENVVEKAWGLKPTPENTHVFLCGSPGMIDGMVSLMGAEGFRENKKAEPGQIHIEKYW